MEGLADSANIPPPLSSILVVEDSPEDYEVTLRALRRTGLRHPIVHCEDGDDAIDFLDAGTKTAIVLLDLNLPGTSGHEVLHHIRSKPELRGVPVVVLTTSADPNDIHQSYQKGANSYLQKPMDLSHFDDMLKRFVSYWFNVVVLPSHHSG